jgi:hypothetical protein
MHSIPLFSLFIIEVIFIFAPFHSRGHFFIRTISLQMSFLYSRQFTPEPFFNALHSFIRSIHYRGHFYIRTISLQRPFLYSHHFTPDVISLFTPIHSRDHSLMHSIPLFSLFTIEAIFMIYAPFHSSGHFCIHAISRKRPFLYSFYLHIRY